MLRKLCTKEEMCDKLDDSIILPHKNVHSHVAHLIWYIFTHGIPLWCMNINNEVQLNYNYVYIILFLFLGTSLVNVKKYTVKDYSYTGH